jgi:hypothetical protein
MLLLLLGSLLASVAWPALAATTYTYSGAPNYSIFTNFTASPCTAGNCENYTTSMTVTGSFTTATPLAPNLVNVDISSQITTYSFNDGINTYAPPNGRIINFNVYTDSSGVPTTSTFLDIQVWTTGTSPHAPGDRFSEFFIDFEANSTNNENCSSVGSNGDSAGDACNSSGTDANSSNAANLDSGTWSGGSAPPPPPTVITPVPALSAWALGALATLVIALGWFQIRRNKRA